MEKHYGTRNTKTKEQVRKNNTNYTHRAVEDHPGHHLLQLQQAIGNRAVQGWLQAKIKITPIGDVNGRETNQMKESGLSILRQVGGQEKTAEIKPTSAKEEGTLDDDLIRIITIVSLAEAESTHRYGQETDIAWIYFNRAIIKNKAGLPAGKAALIASVAYREQNEWYKTWKVALEKALNVTVGDGDYKLLTDLKILREQNSEIDAFNKKKKAHLPHLVNLSEYVEYLGLDKKAKKVYDNVAAALTKPSTNPYVGWIGQGNFKDFNRNDGKWIKARNYYFLQCKDPSLPKLVKVLPANKREDLTFIFDEKAIDKYFETHPLNETQPLTQKDISLYIQRTINSKASSISKPGYDTENLIIRKNIQRYSFDKQIHTKVGNTLIQCESTGKKPEVKKSPYNKITPRYLKSLSDVELEALYRQLEAEPVDESSKVVGEKLLLVKIELSQRHLTKTLKIPIEGITSKYLTKLSEDDLKTLLTNIKTLDPEAVNEIRNQIDEKLKLVNSEISKREAAKVLKISIDDITPQYLKKMSDDNLDALRLNMEKLNTDSFADIKEQIGGGLLLIKREKIERKVKKISVHDLHDNELTEQCAYLTELSSDPTLGGPLSSLVKTKFGIAKAELDRRIKLKTPPNAFVISAQDVVKFARENYEGLLYGKLNLRPVLEKETGKEMRDEKGKIVYEKYEMDMQTEVFDQMKQGASDEHIDEAIKQSGVVCNVLVEAVMRKSGFRDFPLTAHGYSGPGKEPDERFDGVHDLRFDWIFRQSHYIANNQGTVFFNDKFSKRVSAKKQTALSTEVPTKISKYEKGFPPEVKEGDIVILIQFNHEGFVVQDTKQPGKYWLFAAQRTGEKSGYQYGPFESYEELQNITSGYHECILFVLRPPYKGYEAKPIQPDGTPK